MPDITANTSTSVYIFKDNIGFKYTKDNGSATSIDSWPVTIIGSGTSKLTVTFEDGITFDNSDHYFICSSHNIQFGDDNKTTINLDGITNGYPGLIQNGYFLNDNVLGNKQNITIKNLDLKGTGTTIATHGGGIAQSYFGANNNDNNSIINININNSLYLIYNNIKK